MQVPFFEMVFLASRSRRDVVVLADNNIHIESCYFKFFVSVSVSTRVCHSTPFQTRDARKLGSTPRQRVSTFLRCFFFYSVNFY